jgi:bisphosphoglycerate-dependent phosphoglycerate mutase
MSRFDVSFSELLQRDFLAIFLSEFRRQHGIQRQSDWRQNKRHENCVAQPLSLP